jgi:DNA-binding SARP family transcriptional activator
LRWSVASITAQFLQGIEKATHSRRCSMSADDRMIGIVGRLGIRPMVKLSLPARRLLVYLALRGGEVSRQHAADELWPELAEDVGRSNLRRSLWQTPRDWVSTIGDVMVLEADCDLPHARRVAACAIDGQGLTFDEIDLLSQDILPGWHEEWLLDPWEEFRTIRVQALEAACRTFVAHGNFPLAVQAGTAALLADPLRESAVEALIEAHLVQHNRAAALRCYEALVARLASEFGAPPNDALVARMAGVGLGRHAA